jgi:hypothetical protein
MLTGCSGCGVLAGERVDTQEGREQEYIICNYLQTHPTTYDYLLHSTAPDTRYHRSVDSKTHLDC